MSTATSKRKLSVPVVLAGGVSAIVLALGMTPTFSAFSASIANSTNTAGTGTLIMEEKLGGTTTCLSTDGGSINTNSATCATINKYGGNLAMVPGQTVTTSITIKNTGTVDATSFSLTPGTCAQSNNGSTNGSAGDLCSKITVVITSGSSTIYSGTAAGLNAAIDVLSKTAAASVPAGGTVPITFAVKADAALGNTYQGLKISQPMTWTFGA